MNPMETAPKGGGAKLVTDPNWVEPPTILLFFDDDKVSVGYWDWSYAEGGRNYTGQTAWIEPCSGEQLDLHYDPPIGWLPIPETDFIREKTMKADNPAKEFILKMLRAVGAQEIEFSDEGVEFKISNVEYCLWSNGMHTEGYMNLDISGETYSFEDFRKENL